MSFYGNKKILVVEDEVDNLKVILSILEYVGKYSNIATADNGIDAVKVAQQFKPDLILMDLLLPKMNGWDATAKIRTIPELKNVQIIAVTAHAMYGQEKKALASGCDDYVTKPIDVPTLLKKVEEYLEKGSKLTSQ